MRARGLFATLALVAACDAGSSSHPEGAGGTPGSGGATGTGGRTATGGVTGAGGATAGGAPGTGGGAAGGATGGTSSGGTTSGTGGATSAGGATATGGGSGSGGRTGTGGTSVPRSDAGSDTGGRTDSGAGGRGGAGTGGIGGTGGARPDAGPEAGLDARPDAPAERPPDGGADTMASDGRTTSDGAPCPQAGNVTYTLTQNPNAGSDERAAYPLITAAMDKALYYYNCYTDISKKLTVSYNASVQTADGNSNGSIRFGPNTSYMEYTRGMHEIAHTVGIGTASNWQSFLVTPDGGGTRVWSGANATRQLRAITGIATDVLYGDNQHFWPYGLNYASEVKSEADVINHCFMVVALRQDMGNP